ncbi:NAD(+) diphosphatase [Desulfotomaculum defluvii]
MTIVYDREFKQIYTLWFLFQDDKLLVKMLNNQVTPVTSSDLEDLKIDITQSHYLGKSDQLPCYAAELKKDIKLPDYYSFQNLRQLLDQLTEKIFITAGRAYQVIHWDQTHQFCGRCGSHNIDSPDELAKQCPSCRLISYPRISPAVIVAITKGNQILLARNKKFTTNHYSVISGFVEPGETLEECIKREIWEEVGIGVKNIKYFGSQPWPFPDALMIAFTAEYDQGEIKVDNLEIMDAKWFTSDELPSLAAKSTIARRLIDWFINKN